MILTKVKTLALETRPHFLLLTPVCVFLGISSALYHGYFNPMHALLVLVGSVFAHASVNVFNDYYDYVKKTDLFTKRTPFSGGSGFLPAGILTPKETFALAVALMIAGGAIGVYFSIIYPVLIPLILLGAIMVWAYTPILTRVVVTEVFPGLGFGLMVIGSYITMLPPGSVVIHKTPVASAVLAGILISNLLFLNEFPDYEADLKTGRRHMVIVLGKRRASKVYVLLIAAAYVWVAASILCKALPLTSALSFLTIPIAAKACSGCLRNYDNTEKLIPSMARNVLVVLLTPVLLAIGLLLSKLI